MALRDEVGARLSHRTAEQKKTMFSRGFLMAMIPVAVCGALVLTRAQREMSRSDGATPVAIE
jgi:hypothetical protein